MEDQPRRRAHHVEKDGDFAPALHAQLVGDRGARRGLDQLQGALTFEGQWAVPQADADATPGNVGEIVTGKP